MHLVPFHGIEPQFSVPKTGVLPLDENGMAGTAGIEPATERLTIACSASELHSKLRPIGESNSCDLIDSQALYH